MNTVPRGRVLSSENPATIVMNVDDNIIREIARGRYSRGDKYFLARLSIYYSQEPLNRDALFLDVPFMIRDEFSFSVKIAYYFLACESC